MTFTSARKLTGEQQPGTGGLNSDYGWRKRNGQWEFHPGIDLAPGDGNARSVYSGRVIESRESSTFGHLVVVQYDNGEFGLYGHLANPGLAAGKVVQAGNVLGTIGNTGDSNGRHLHYSHFTEYSSSDWTSCTVRNPSHLGR